MDADRVRATLDLFTAEVESAADNLGLQSACSEWTIGQVIRHVIHVQRAVTLPLLRGREPGRMRGLAEVSDFEAAAAWRQVAEEVRAAAEAPGAVVTNRLALPMLDTTVHAWDLRAGLARVGLDQPLELDAQTLTWIHAFRKHAPEELIRREGMFGPEQPAPDGASPTAAFMAWAGRPVPSG